MEKYSLVSISFEIYITCLCQKKIFNPDLNFLVYTGNNNYLLLEIHLIIININII